MTTITNLNVLTKSPYFTAALSDVIWLVSRPSHMSSSKYREPLKCRYFNVDRLRFLHACRKKT